MNPRKNQMKGKMMKRKVALVTVLIIAFVFLGCSGGMKVIKSPHSDLQLKANELVRNGGLAVVGTGISSREDLARKQAQNDGRTLLSNALETKVKGYEKQFQEEIGTAGDAEINEAFQAVSEQLTKSILVGVLPTEEVITMKDGKYTIYTIMAIDPKIFIQSFQDQMKEQKAAYTRYRQSQMHKEMEQKLEDYDKF